MEIIIVLVIVVAGLFLGLALAAVILRAACSFAKTTVPGFGLAIGIVLVTAIVQAVISSIINAGFGIPFIQDPAQPIEAGKAISASVVGFLVNTPITMLLYKLMIPTESFGKAALVWLMQILIVIGIVVIMVVIIFGLGMILGGF